MNGIPECKEGQYIRVAKDGPILLLECVDAPTPVQEEFAALLQFLRTEAEEGVAAAKTQVPTVVRDIVVYHRTVSTLQTSLLIVLLLLVVLLRRGIRKAVEAASEGEETSGISLAVVSGIGCIPCFVLGVSGINDCIRAWFTPSLVILDYVRGLL